MTYPILMAAETADGGSSIWVTLLMVAALVAFFYFVMYRPQKKQDKQVQEMRDSLVVGDEITTIGGIIGKIISIKEETCMIETGRDKTRIRILKSAVRRVDVPDEAARALAAEKRAADAKKAEEELAAKEAEMKAKRAEELANKKAKKAQKGKKTEVEAPAKTSEEVTKDTPAEDKTEE